MEFCKSAVSNGGSLVSQRLRERGFGRKSNDRRSCNFQEVDFYGDLVNRQPQTTANMSVNKCENRRSRCLIGRECFLFVMIYSLPKDC